MKIISLTIILFLALLASGCASMSGWQPTVDPYGDPNPSRIQFDIQECASLAKDNAHATKDTLIGAGVGALVGGAGGAALGAVVGNPAGGAALGAAALGFGGGAYKGFTSDQEYQTAYRNCLRNRGHKVL